MTALRDSRSTPCRVLLLLAAAVACLAAAGCRGATSAPAAADSAPRFADAVVDQTWTLGVAVRFRLPFASGGDGP